MVCTVGRLLWLRSPHSRVLSLQHRCPARALALGEWVKCKFTVRGVGVGVVKLVFDKYSLKEKCGKNYAVTFKQASV